MACFVDNAVALVCCSCDGETSDDYGDDHDLGADLRLAPGDGTHTPKSLKLTRLDTPKACRTIHLETARITTTLYVSISPLKA